MGLENTGVSEYYKELQAVSGGDNPDAATTMDEANLFHSRVKVPTPIAALNAYLGGGVPFGTITEVLGPPKAGKSTLTYAIAGTFQAQHPLGLVYILDTEMSTEKIRMQAMGMDLQRTVRLPSATLEGSFQSIHKILTKKKEIEMAHSGEEGFNPSPVMIIWDTIAAAATQKQLDNPGVLNPGGMNERPRLIKSCMRGVMNDIEGQDAALWIINQVYTHFDKYGHTKLDSGGGFGLKHGCHFRILVKPIEEGMDEFLVNFQISAIDVLKTKSTPGAKGFNMTLNNLEGGLIDVEYSLMLFLIGYNLIVKSQGWFLIPYWYDDKGYRKDPYAQMLKNDPRLVTHLTNFVLIYIAKKSSYLRKVYFGPDMKEEDLEKWIIEERDKMFKPEPPPEEKKGDKKNDQKAEEPVAEVAKEDLKEESATEEADEDENVLAADPPKEESKEAPAEPEKPKKKAAKKA